MCGKIYIYTRAGFGFNTDVGASTAAEGSLIIIFFWKGEYFTKFNLRIKKRTVTHIIYMTIATG